MSEYEIVIGLETHIQLNTKSKIFCACKADSWGDEPNTNICPICSGLPGTLPVLNKAAVEKAVLLAHAMNADIRDESFFDRKNYFYPDLPKGYQITQFDKSVALGGYLKIDGREDPVRIEKLHLEEDAGKTKHDGKNRMVDFNRCGVPLVEMVTAPDLRSADEAAEYLVRLRQILRWLDISEANMEKAHLRADANVSIRLKGEKILNTKTEIKNVNSIEAVRIAINKEFARQVKEVEAGREIKPWTLDWDEDTETLKKMRSKETEADYRYFKEPDLMRVELTLEWKQEILSNFPKLPLEVRDDLIEKFELPKYDAEIIISERSLLNYFENSVSKYGNDPKQVKKISNWLMNDVMKIMNEKGITAGELKITPEYLVEIIKLSDEKTINTPTAKSLLQKVEDSGKSPKEIVADEGLAQVSDVDTLVKMAEEIVAENPDQTQQFREGKESLIGWFVGQMMRRSQGKAAPELAKKLLLEQLNKS